MIDPDRSLLFVHIARTGGTSIEAALVGTDWWKIDPSTKHISASQARRLYGEQVWRTFTKFSVVRSPWDRIASMWSAGWWYENGTPFGGKKPASLKDFILGLKPHPNEHYASLHYCEILDDEMDYILRFEHLRADFSSMFRVLGKPEIELPHLEASLRKHYRSYFDAETAALVANMFEDDIRRYQYAF
jgi:Sulfotransferase family